MGSNETRLGVLKGISTLCGVYIKYSHVSHGLVIYLESEEGTAYLAARESEQELYGFRFPLTESPERSSFVPSSCTGGRQR